VTSREVASGCLGGAQVDDVAKTESVQLSRKILRSGASEPGLAVSGSFVGHCAGGRRENDSG
jgi:hypothetical protein